MFQRLLSQMREPFGDYSSNGPDTQGTNKIQQYYGVRLPNAVYTNDNNMTLNTMTATPNERMTTNNPALQDPWTVPNGENLLITSRQTACAGTGGDTFDKLVSLTQNYDPQSRARCGWLYGVPYNTGKGAYGISNGPLDSSAATAGQRWMWNLAAAKQKYHTELCNQVSHCSDLDASQFKGRCGWCSTSGTAIPINADGTVAYPLSPLTACAATAISASSSRCPPPRPPPPSIPGQPTPVVPDAQLCDPNSDHRLSKACLLSKVKDAGCSTDGTLYQALRSGSDTNYFDSLAQASAYILYQARAAVGLDQTGLSHGAVTTAIALNDFGQVKTYADLGTNTGLNYAARDLCYKAGSMETFDFCTEITDAQQGPFGLNCLQKQFLRAGGQKTGLKYPSIANMNMWNSSNTWADVKTVISTLSANTKSSNRVIQEQAMKDYYGISLQNKTLPMLGAIPGIEIFWFDVNPVLENTNTIFLGRRIRSTIPLINQSNDLKGAINQGDVSMVFFANLAATATKSVRFRVTSQDGFALHFNEPLGNGYRIGKYTNDVHSLMALDVFPPTTFTNTAAWPLTAGGQNLLSGFYFQKNGTGGPRGMIFKVEVQDYTPGTTSDPDCRCAGSPGPGNGFARQYTTGQCASVGGINAPQGGNYYSNGECLIGHGISGSYSAKCGYLNALGTSCTAAVAGTWATVPSNMLNMTQEPYAPMVSFQVYKSPQDFGADFNFADKRMGSYKMKWMTYTGTPTWVYNFESNTVHPFGLPVVRFSGNSSMRMIGRFKMYSFMTMTIAMTFNSLPANSANTEEYISIWGELGRIGIRVQGGYQSTTGVNQGLLKLYAEGGDTASVEGPRVEQGTPYLLILRVIRSDETDIYTAYGLTISAQKVDTLINNPSSMIEYGKLTFSNPSRLSNPDTTESRTMSIGNGAIDVAWIRMYDYYLDTAHLAREIEDDWQYLGQS